MTSPLADALHRTIAAEKGRAMTADSIIDRLNEWGARPATNKYDPELAAILKDADRYAREPAPLTVKRAWWRFW